MKTLVKQMLEGEITMDAFMPLFLENKELKTYISNLIPVDAVNNPGHILWKNYSYDALFEVDFDLYQHLMYIVRLDGSIGDSLNLSSSLYRVYSYHYPETKLTNIYSNLFDLYLDVVRECYGGPEVEPLIEEIVRSCIDIRPKKTRNKITREKMLVLFHIKDNKFPRWIQGAEWPCGKSTPMQFIKQRRIPEGVEYLFCDFETGEERVIQQFY